MKTKASHHQAFSHQYSWVRQKARNLSDAGPQVREVFGFEPFDLESALDRLYLKAGQVSALGIALLCSAEVPASRHGYVDNLVSGNDANAKDAARMLVHDCWADGRGLLTDTARNVTRILELRGIDAHGVRP